MCLTAKILTNTLYAAKQGNAEEQSDAGCGIKLWKAAANAAASKSMIAVSLALLAPFRQCVVGHTKLRGCLLDSNFI